MMMLVSWLAVATAPAGNFAQGGIAQQALQNFWWPMSCKLQISVNLSDEEDHKRALQSREELTRPPEWVDATHLT